MEKSVEVSMRRAPKFFSFFVFGAVLGAITGVVIWALTQQNKPGDLASLIGYITLVTTILGAGLGLLLALVFDRISVSRSKTLEATKLEQSASN